MSTLLFSGNSSRFNSMIVRLKGCSRRYEAYHLQSFNSMIVRLKEVVEELSVEAIYKRFQFYDSPIKRKVDGIFSKVVSHSFNSMIVRLKGLVRDVFKGELSCFNSMIVRLKDNSPSTTSKSYSCFNSMIVRLKVNRARE